jgi:hypothetical protein
MLGQHSTQAVAINLKITKQPTNPSVSLPGDSGCGEANGDVRRSLERGGPFCVGAFGSNLASVAVQTFAHSIYFTKKCYKACTSKVIGKDNA